ncbi:MAG: hypothetical protein GX638_15425 [Crenarchaeota archaeon]|nr:hypothetical protein [Thermoproteota archaeon]
MGYNFKLICLGLLFLFLVFCFFGLTTSIKADSQFTSVQWLKTFGAGPSSGINSMCATTDEGFALAGHVLYLGDPMRYTSDMWFVKTDSNGEVEWAQSYLNLGEASSIIQTVDNGYALTGPKSLIKTDSNGNIEWNCSFSNGSPTNVVQTCDSGYAVVGTIFLTNHTFWFTKLDAFGNFQWNQSYAGTGSEIAWSLKQTNDDGFIISGGSTYGNYGKLIKTDSSGIVQWSQTYNGVLFSVIQTNDNGYALVGCENIDNNSTMFLLKVSSLGDKQWTQNLNAGRAWSVIQTNDTGYAIVGDSSLIKTDSSGTIQWVQTCNGTAFSVAQINNEDYVLAGRNLDTTVNCGAWLMKISTTATSNPSETQNQNGTLYPFISPTKTSASSSQTSPDQTVSLLPSSSPPKGTLFHFEILFVILLFIAIPLILGVVLLFRKKQSKNLI